MKPFAGPRHEPITAVHSRIEMAATQAGRVAGDFSEVYRRHAATVARWAARLGGPEVDWEDVVQEVFVTVNRRLGEFRGDGKLTTWLFRITEKTVRNARRKARLRRFFHLGLAQRPAIAAVTPAEELERRQQVERLYATLARLGERARTVLVLFELEGLSTEEIGELLRARPGTVRVWLHRARAQFLAQFEREAG